MLKIYVKLLKNSCKLINGKIYGFGTEKALYNNLTC